jgi:hypothetical protein
MVRGLKGCQAEVANRIAAASQHLISIPNAHKPTGLVKGTKAKHPQAGKAPSSCPPKKKKRGYRVCSSGYAATDTS